MAEGRNRGVWIIAGALLVAALLIGGFVWWQNKEQACDRWREDARLLVDDVGDVNLSVDTPASKAFLERMVALVQRRPNGCPAPESPYREILETELSDE